MAKTRKYGIKFPFNIKSLENTFFDLNDTPGESIKSQLMHLLFTPIGQRLRRPNFGSRLIQFIFNPNDGQTWGDVVSEIKEMVSHNIPNCNLEEINVYAIDEGRTLVASIRYGVKENGGYTEYQIMTKL